MPAPLARGAIIVASILIAAGLAAYESDNIRAWVEKTKQKIVTSFDNLSNDLKPRRPMPMRVLSNDASMTEEKGEEADARREQMRAQIAERARILEERSRKQTRPSTGPKSPSFDSMVDEEGRLRSSNASPPPLADSTAIETSAWEGELRSRRGNVQKPMDVPTSTGQLPVTQQNVADLEREMRSTFSIPIPDRNIDISSHASESLVDLTPTTEDFPDPDYSIPSLHNADVSHQRSEYFSATASASSHTMSDTQPEFYYAHPSRLLEPLERHAPPAVSHSFQHSVSSAPSVADSTSLVNPSEAEMSEDDLLSEPDGMRTPASAWTEVGSQASGDDRLVQ